MSEMEINLPEVLAEVRAVFDRYERALVTNDLAALDSLFWADPRVLRYGAAENLHGIEELRQFRAARSPAGLDRKLDRTVITTFGRELATANTLFRRVNDPRCGRQSQTWVKLAGDWKIVAAHVSLIPLDKA
jgi:hypothetical protein